MSTLFAVLLAAAVSAHPLTIDGTICRMNRLVDRIIVATDAGPRFRVVMGSSAAVRFAAHRYQKGDMRPGDRVHLIAFRQGARLQAKTIDVTMRAGDALLDSLLRSRRTIVGRFAVRELKTEVFSLNLPGDSLIRVDAQRAQGPNGRVRVSSLKPGDLLEIRGSWPSKGLLQASSINVITDYEPSFCRSHARRGEWSADTSAREADERRFLDHVD
jgi:hypothetical protein